MRGPVKEDCIFCRIVAGSARAHRVAEDEHTLTFMDLFPVSEGHTLIIPKPHWENLFETPAEAIEAVVRTSKTIAHAIMSTIAPDGLGVYQLNGAAAGQTVFHYHMHLIPRMHGSRMGIHGRIRAERDHLEAVATTIKAGIAR